MYGWDSYFIALGLLEDGRDELARGMVDNHVYQITHYGKVLNANRTYYLLRSQPPLLTSMALAVYERLPRDDASRAWLARVLLAAIREYREVWMGPDRLDTATGLSHYAGGGSGVPPEVEQEHFDPIFQPHAVKQGLGVGEFEAAYKAGRVRVPKLDAFFVHDAAVRESGHDTTYRWSAGGDRVPTSSRSTSTPCCTRSSWTSRGSSTGNSAGRWSGPTGSARRVGTGTRGRIGGAT